MSLPHAVPQQLPVALADHLTDALDLVADCVDSAATLAAKHRDRSHARLAVDLVQAAEQIVRTRELLAGATS